VVGHWRYANLIGSPDMPYSLENIVFGKQATHEAHRGALGQSLEERRFQKQQTLGENLPFLNGPKGILNIRLFRWGCLRGKIRSSLTR